MPEWSFPFPSVNGDRKYGTMAWTTYFRSLVTNGVHPNGDQLFLTPAGGMAVSLSPGVAIINGQLYCNPEEKIIQLDVADGVLNRKDRIILRSNRLNREITAMALKGTPASGAQEAELQRDADVYDMAMYTVEIDAGISEISQEKIRDTRTDTSVCGIMSLITPPNSSAWFAQYEAMFNSWFQHIQNTLDDDVAASLARDVALLFVQTESLQEQVDSANADIATKANKEGALSEVKNAAITVPANAWTENQTASRYEATISDASITASRDVIFDIADDQKGLYAVYGLRPGSGTVKICSPEIITAPLRGQLIIREVG